MYRSKMRDLAYELGKDELKGMGSDTPAPSTMFLHVMPIVFGCANHAR